MFAVIKTQSGAKIVNHEENPAYFRKGNSLNGAEGITCPEGESLYGMFSKRPEAERHIAKANQQIREAAEKAAAEKTQPITT